MTDREIDALLQQVLVDALKLDWEEGLKKPNSFEPSLQYQHQIESMLKDPKAWAQRRPRPMWKIVFQKAAVIVLVFSLSFGGLMIFNPSARAFVVRWITEWYETHIVYRYFGDQISGDMPEYEISALPEGYSEFQREEQPNSIFVTYQGKTDGNQVFLRYVYMQQGSAVDFDTENSEGIPIMIQGWEGMLYTSENTEYSTVTWIDPIANIQFIIDAPFSGREILAIAEGVKLKE